MNYLKAAINRALDAQMVLVGSSSNNPARDQNIERQVPANIGGIISVSNVNYNAQMQSAYGENTDTAFYGTDIFVWDGIDYGYSLVKGSSYATPLVAFSIALKLSMSKKEDPFDHTNLRKKIRTSCERQISGPRNVASHCVFSPSKLILEELN